MTKHTKHTKKKDETFVEKEVTEVKREWRHFLKFGDENRLLFAAFVVVITSFLVVNTIYIINRGSDRSNDTAKTTVLPDPNQVFTSLQVAFNSAARVQVSNVSESDKHDYAFTLPQDETLLTMKVIIANETAETQHLIPVNMFFVRSDEGDYSALHPSIYATAPLQAQDVKPGDAVEGQISFSVPKRVARPLLYVDTGWGNYAPLVFDVLH